MREWLRLTVAEGVDPVAEAARLRATPSLAHASRPGS